MTRSAQPAPPESLLEQAGWVRRLARRLVADAHQAEDLAQETLVRALERPPRGGEPLRGWLATVLRNLLAERRRGAGRRGERERRAARPEHTAASDDLVREVATQRDVVDAVLALEEPYRSTLLLRYFEELSTRRIAARQGVPLATVKTRLARGRAALRVRLDQRHGGDGRAWVAALLPLARPPAGQLVPALASALPRTTHLVLGALIVNAKVLLIALAVALLGALAFVALRPDASSQAAAPQTAALDPRAAELAATLEPVAEIERAAQPAPEARTAVHQPPAAEPQAAAKAPVAAAAPAVRGRVVDLASAPLAGVKVALRDDVGSESAPAGESARTGSDGSFRLALADGRGYLRVDDPRWTTVLAGTTVRESTGQEAIVVAAPRLALLGVVLDAASGQPVAGAHVRVELPADFRADFALDLDHSVNVPFAAETDGAGEFLLGDAPLCAEARLVCAAEGFLPHEEPLPLADGARRVIALERAPVAGVLRGRVVDLAGQPVEDARVSLGLDITQSDAQGGFAFDLQAPERFTAQFNVMAAEFGGDALVPDTLLALVPGALPASFTASRSPAGDPVWPAYVTLRLRLGEEPLAIAGTVFGAGGEPAAGARVWLADPTFFGGLGDPSAGDGPDLVHVETLLADAEGAWHAVTADEHGRFRIEGLMDREYTVAAMDEGTLLRAVVPGVPAGRDHLVIELPVAEVYPVLAGTVVGHDGKALAGVTVFPMCDAFELKVGGNVIGTHHAAAEGGVTDEEGRFRLVNVPRNLVYLRLEGPDVLPLEWGRHVEGGLFELVGDRASELEIAVDRRCHFQIELADPAEADEFELLDAAGHNLEISEFAGHNRRESDRQPLVAGRTNPMAASDSTATVVLYLAGEEVRRAPAHLVFGERVTLRP